jgi:hypothetical protein
VSKSSFIKSSAIKSLFCASIFALALLNFTAPQSAIAQTSEQYAKGTYQFTLDDRYTKYVEFEAIGRGDGSATGSMLLSDEAPVAYQDVDGTGDKGEDIKGFYIKAEFDGLVVNKNQAVMSGTVRDSSVRDFIGQRVLLTVEDNADNPRIPDRLTWGVYRPIDITWKPSDSELKEDPGVGLRWWAKDYERKDDVGYAMPRDTAVTAQSNPVASYAFIDPANWAGDIVVKP